MPIDRKSLRERMKEARRQGMEDAKAIIFPLPDLRGPGGNAFVLTGMADTLMKDNNIPDSVRDNFRKEATSGDYEHLLKTIQEWFTVAVADTSYVPIGNRDILTLMPNSEGDDDWSQFDDQPQTDDTELTEALESYEANAERDRKLAEVQDRINREVRAELGLEDDDVVIVQVKKAKKS